MPKYKRLQRLLYHPCSSDHAAKQRTRLYRRFSCDLTHSTAHDTRPTQAAIIPPVPRWSVSQRRSTSSTYQILAPRRTLYRSAHTAYYNNVYKGAALLWIHARQRNTSQTMPARRRSAPTVCGSLASALPGTPAEWSASPPVQGQPGGLQFGTGQRSGRTGWHPPPGGAVQRWAARNH